MKGVALFVVCGFVTLIQGHRIVEKKATCSKKIDLALVLDASASIGKENFKLFKTFARELINRFTLSPSKTKVSLTYFSERHHIVSKFSDEYTKTELMDMAEDLPYEGSFSSLAKTVDGVHFTIFDKKNGARIPEPDPPCAEKVQRNNENDVDDDDDDDDEELKSRPRDPGAKMVTVFFTDAFGTQGSEEVSYMADSLEDYGVEVFAVGVPGQNYNDGMEALVSEPKRKHSLQISRDNKETKKTLDKLVKRICKIKRKRY